MYSYLVYVSISVNLVCCLDYKPLEFGIHAIWLVFIFIPLVFENLCKIFSPFCVAIRKYWTMD